MIGREEQLSEKAIIFQEPGRNTTIFYLYLISSTFLFEQTKILILPDNCSVTRS